MKKVLTKTDYDSYGIKTKDYNLKWADPLAFSRTPMEYILLHHPLWYICSMLDIHNDHLKKGWRGTGYNFHIRKSGIVELGRLPGTVTAHCKEQKMNFRSIGISFEGNYTDYKNLPVDKDLTPEQMDAGIRLINLLMDTFNIPLDNVRPHRDFNTTKDCPGKYFPLTELMAGLQKDSELINALDILSENNIINSLDYWQQNLQAGKDVKEEYVRKLILNMSEYIQKR